MIKIMYDRNFLGDAFPFDKNGLIITTPPIVEQVKRQFKGHHLQIHLAPAMDEATLKAWEFELPGFDSILGIGGGVCMDAAKYLAWRRHLPLWLAPSVVSVDACLTDTIGVRRNGRVAYIGKIYPQAVLVDFSLIQAAPAHLNRAGAGDILSIHTALWDWQTAAKIKNIPYDRQIADQSAQLLKSLEESATEIYNVTEIGIKKLMELFAAEVHLCTLAGTSRPEEGSEHFWAYNAEYHTRRGYVHGELVALAVLLMAILQENNYPQAKNLIDKLGIRWRPEEIGISQQEIIETLMTARAYVEADNLPFTVLNTRTITLELADEILTFLPSRL